ncbi:hypothetical protein MCJ35_03175 [Enterocloster sp. OA13]|uniref:hypothetical protein n=1 Tax=Enterocloster sp. OA13 TaxID=2914161 RepID=UPI000471B02A|nr:hypothetical protein [Enterocloster sp. OA13]
MYKIGILEDRQKEIDNVILVIMENGRFIDNIPEITEESFVIYKVDDHVKVKNQIIRAIENDINENVIQGLIVDYKIDTKKDIFTGADVVRQIKDTLTEFPIVILTAAVDMSRTSVYVDPDKTYNKEVFFNVDKPESLELTKNIFRNMERYVQLREKLEVELDQELNNLGNEFSDLTLSKVIKIENELSKYKKLEMTQIDKTLDISVLKETMETLRNIEESID